MRIALLIAGSLLATACGGREAAEQPPMADTGMAQSDAGGAFAEQPPSAPEFAQTAAMSDMYEITTANLALKNAENEKTREFAQMMVADHTKSSQALKQAISASGQTLTLPTKLDAEHQAKVDILQRLDGLDFDREYINQQIAAHRKTLTLLKAYAGNGDVAELRQFAQSTIPAVQKHHDWLEDNSLVSGATGGTPGATMGATPAP
jgi:putative membrane protein